MFQPKVWFTFSLICINLTSINYNEEIKFEPFASSLSDSESLNDNLVNDLSVPILNRREISEICQSQDINLKIDELDSALRFLNQTGSILNYEDTKNGLQGTFEVFRKNSRFFVLD